MSIAKLAAVTHHKQLSYSSLAACVGAWSTQTDFGQLKLVLVVRGACGQPSLGLTNFGQVGPNLDAKYGPGWTKFGQQKMVQPGRFFPPQTKNFITEQEQGQ